MPVRLSELLDRIRPAGSPGAPTEGEQQRRSSERAAEVEAIELLLATFEREADEVVAAAAEQADRIRRRADDAARRRRATVPDRIADAERETASQASQRSESLRERVESETEAEIARLLDQADHLIPTLVASATELIWDAAAAGPRHEDRR